MDSPPWAKRRNSSIERNANTRERERERGGLDVVESETNVARKPRTVSYLYSPAVRTSTLSRMDSKRVVARYPCIMIISHLDTLNPAPCHRPVASCTIFLCLALFHPARHRSPRPPQPTFTASFLLRSNLRSNLRPRRVFHVFYQRLKNPVPLPRTNSSLYSRLETSLKETRFFRESSGVQSVLSTIPRNGGNLLSRSTVLQLFTRGRPFPRID